MYTTKVPNIVTVLLVTVYFSICNHKAQVFHQGLVKGIFGQLQVEFLLYLLENSSGAFLAFLLGLGKHQYIVHVYHKPSFSNHVSKCRVHKSLECWRRVALPKEHYQRFIKAIRGFERRLPLVTFLISDILYPHWTSILEKYLAPFSLPIMVEIKGRG